MFKKILHFIKYNNAMVLILVFIFVAGSGVFAASETGQELIGTEQKRVDGIDNTLLLEADLNNFDMGFKIEKVEEDEKYYYVTYTYLDLELKDDAWQYVLNEKIRKVSKKLKQDLGEYLAEELEEEYFARTSYLRKERQKAESEGEEVREEVSEYSGLRGRFLKIGENIFPGYTAVKVRTLPSPTLPATLPSKKTISRETADGIESDSDQSVPADNITEVYEDYIARMDPDKDDVFGILDNCPETYNPDQLDTDGDGVGDACASGSVETPDVENPDNENTGESGDENASETESGTDDASGDTADENGESETGTETEGENTDGSAGTGTDTEGETTDGGTDTNNVTDPEDVGDKSGDSEGSEVSTDSTERDETTSEETTPSDAPSDDYETVEVVEYPESGNEEKSVE